MAETRGAAIVYDGACPFCSRYVELVRLREALGYVALVNAREGGPLVDEVRRTGLDLDEGMVLKLGDRFYHGADCIHMLAVLGTSSGLFNRATGTLFRSPAVARCLYPFLQAGRNATLALPGRRKMSAACPARTADRGLAVRCPPMGPQR